MMQSDSLRIAYYCTGHGLGHVTRTIEIVRHLLEDGHSVTVVTGAPPSVFRKALPSEHLDIRESVLDVGAKQLDAFTVDMKGSLEAYLQVAVLKRAELLEVETAWLRSWGANLVVSDIVPLACAAAAAADVHCVCVSNFSWDFIYSEYLSSVGSGFRGMVWQIAEDYSKADLLLRLPGYSPMPAFREVRDTALVVRRARKPPAQVRQELGVPEGKHMLMFMFGGQPAGDWRLREESLPPGWVCVICSAGRLAADFPLPANYILAPHDVYTPDVVAAADCLLGKIGYGSTSECLAHGKPLIFVRRDYFNEEPFLRKLLHHHELAIEMTRRDFLAGTWVPFLNRALSLRKAVGLQDEGAAEVARTLVEEARTPGTPVSLRNLRGIGSTRLRDAIVWGYMMQRHKDQKKVEVPDWYTNESQPMGTPIMGSSPQDVQLLEPPPDTNFEILHGVAALSASPDTHKFLRMLAGFADDSGPDAGDFVRDGPRDSSSREELPEYRAARCLFSWEEDIYVTRAPGRLDVMGGIADYSGSLVLQMPIAEACHVACQVQPTHKQRLWRHTLARQAGKGGPQPALRIVSFQADSTNRGPAFDMDLADFLDEEGKPISYEAARIYFAHDPPVRWAAYVAGCVLVLMREKGLRFTEGISILIASAVPEGKGVSSSAAVEVAVMQALVASHAIPLAANELPILCQKVENKVVGAPCGIMDQMAVALGDKGSLLALTCQPAELHPRVHIPYNARFWGIDSGIRHSVGGSDYGTVRTAAFMGLHMLSKLGQREEPVAKTHSMGRTWSSPMGVAGRSFPEGCPFSAIGGGYLTNISPSKFAQLYADLLPSSMSGDHFLSNFKDHWDPATCVLPGVQYPVRAATSHPIHENFRVELFRLLLSSTDVGPSQLAALGELMYQSHASYNKCGLGSEGTDRIVALVRAEEEEARKAGQEPALWGAKITGGGSGGTVCVLGSADKRGEEALQRVLAMYADETGGYQPYVFSGSSPGASAFGHVRIRWKRSEGSGLDV